MAVEEQKPEQDVTETPKPRKKGPKKPKKEKSKKDATTEDGKNVSKGKQNKSKGQGHPNAAQAKKDKKQRTETVPPNGTSTSETQRGKPLNNGKKIGGGGHKDFPPYYLPEMVEKGLRAGILVQGTLRINSKRYEDAYVTDPSPKNNDILISGIRSRNRALHGDEVRIRDYLNFKQDAMFSFSRLLLTFSHPRIG